MIVKILKADASKAFGGVRYNTNKVDLEKGELMAVKNFDALMGLTDVRPQDYVNYLINWSNRSQRIKHPQLHAVISTKGREADKHELAKLAEQWLDQMGYGQNPYLLIYHKDTANNHIHLVTSRVGPDGKKVDDSFERKKAYEIIHQLTDTVPEPQFKQHLEKALAFRFATRAQFMMLLEASGYLLKVEGDHYNIYKFGKQQGTVLLKDVDSQITDYKPDKDRLHQLRAMVAKYRSSYSALLSPDREKLAGGREGKIIGYHSELTDFLRLELGLSFVFHSKGDQAPYGYTLIDNAKRIVYKGGMLMPLAELTSEPDIQTPPIDLRKVDVSFLLPGPKYANIDVAPIPEVVLPSEPFSPIPAIAAESGFVPSLRMDISGDIDDEQILGRNRKRKRKARTNTR